MDSVIVSSINKVAGALGNTLNNSVKAQDREIYDEELPRYTDFLTAQHQGNLQQNTSPEEFRIANKKATEEFLGGLPESARGRYSSRIKDVGLQADKRYTDSFHRRAEQTQKDLLDDAVSTPSISLTASEETTIEKLQETRYIIADLVNQLPGVSPSRRKFLTEEKVNENLFYNIMQKSQVDPEMAARIFTEMGKDLSFKQQATIHNKLRQQISTLELMDKLAKFTEESSPEAFQRYSVAVKQKALTAWAEQAELDETLYVNTTDVAGNDVALFSPDAISRFTLLSEVPEGLLAGMLAVLDADVGAGVDTETPEKQQESIKQITTENTAEVVAQLKQLANIPILGNLLKENVTQINAIHNLQSFGFPVDQAVVLLSTLRKPNNRGTKKLNQQAHMERLNKITDLNRRTPDAKKMSYLKIAGMNYVDDVLGRDEPTEEVQFGMAEQDLLQVYQQIQSTIVQDLPDDELSPDQLTAVEALTLATIQSRLFADETGKLFIGKPYNPSQQALNIALQNKLATEGFKIHGISEEQLFDIIRYKKKVAKGTWFSRLLSYGLTMDESDKKKEAQRKSNPPRDEEKIARVKRNQGIETDTQYLDFNDPEIQKELEQRHKEYEEPLTGRDKWLKDLSSKSKGSVEYAIQKSKLDNPDDEGLAYIDFWQLLGRNQKPVVYAMDNLTQEILGVSVTELQNLKPLPIVDFQNKEVNYLTKHGDFIYKNKTQLLKNKLYYDDSSLA